MKRPVRVVGELDGAGDRDVVRAVARLVWSLNGQAVDQQVHPGITAHVDRLAAALDGAEQDVIAVLLDEDHRRLRLPVLIDGRQDAEMRTAQDVADGLVEAQVFEIGHTYLDSQRGSEESLERPSPFTSGESQHDVAMTSAEPDRSR
jgi:hypothetical protein